MKKGVKILIASASVLAVFLILAISLINQAKESDSISEFNTEIETLVSKNLSLEQTDPKVVSLLEQRKALLLEQLKTNPRDIYNVSLPSSVLENLRLAGYKNIEKSVTNLSGTLEMMHYDDFENPENSVFKYYIVTRDGTKYRLYPFNEASLAPNTKIEIKGGIQLDTNIFGEARSLSVSIAAVPDIITINTGTTITWHVAEATSCMGSGGYNGWAGPKSITGGIFSTGKLTSNKTYIITCQNSFATITDSVTVTVVQGITVENYINNVLTAYDSSVTEPVPYKIGVFLVNPNPNWPIPFPVEDVKKEIFDGQYQKFIKEASYGKRYVSGDVYGWIQLNQEAPDCTPIDGGVINMNNSGIKNFIIQNNIPLNLYNYILIVVHCTNNNGIAGGGYKFEINGITYTKPVALINIKADGLTTPWVATGGLVQPFPWTIFDRLLSHELGHVFGLWSHAQGLDCNNEAIGEHCQKINYGNSFDSMGERGYSLQYNGLYKKGLGWLNQNQILKITQSGRYTINALETKTGIKYAVISNPASMSKKYYSVEYRKAIGFDSILNNSALLQNQNGILINQSRIGGIESLLIDSKPTEQSWYPDIQNAALSADTSDTFNDANSGITISDVKKIQNAISFNVKISTELPPCIYNPVEITTYSPFYTYSLVDHSNYAYENFIILKNNDNEDSCAPSTYKKVITPIDNVLTPNEVSEYTHDTYIEPGQTKSLPIYRDLINPNAVPGMYTYNINVKNVTFPDSPETNATFTINVVP